MLDSSPNGGCYLLTQAVMNHPLLKQEFVATVGKFISSQEELKHFFIEKQLPLFGSIQNYFTFLSDIIIYFPIYIDCNADVPSSEFVATRILILAIQ